MRRTAGRKPVSRRKKQPKTIQYFDYSLLATIIFLVCFGLVILYSTSAYSAQEKFNDPMWYFRKQAIITVGSLIVMAIVSRINYHVYARFAKLSYVVAFILMLLILTPFGIEANGARRWVGIPDTPLQIQPAEVVKIAVILYIPFLVCRTGKYIEKWDHLKEILIYGGAAGIGVLILTDNLSSAIHCTWNYCDHFICILSEDKENRAVFYDCRDRWIYWSSAVGIFTGEKR